MIQLSAATQKTTVKYIRELKNVSQDYLAQLLGVSRSVYTYMELNNIFENEHLILIADELKVPVDLFIPIKNEIADLLSNEQPQKSQKITLSDSATDLFESFFSEPK